MSLTHFNWNDSKSNLMYCNSKKFNTGQSINQTNKQTNKQSMSLSNPLNFKTSLQNFENKDFLFKNDNYLNVGS